MRITKTTCYPRKRSWVTLCPSFLLEQFALPSSADCSSDSRVQVCLADNLFSNERHPVLIWPGDDLCALYDDVDSCLDFSGNSAVAGSGENQDVRGYKQCGR